MVHGYTGGALNVVDCIFKGMIKQLLIDERGVGWKYGGESVRACKRLRSVKCRSMA